MDPFPGARSGGNDTVEAGVAAMGRAILFCSPLFFAACGKPAAPAPGAQRVETEASSADFAQLRAHLANLAAHDRWQGSLVLVDAGDVVFAHSEGTLEPGGASVDADTRFRIGSITKVYTAAMIFQLIDEGKLALDTPLARWFPDVPNADSITIEQMLDHHSGLFNFTDAPEYAEWMTEPVATQTLVARIASYAPTFLPGESVGYSNSGYVLLGFIIEAVEGKPYREVVRARLLDRLGASRTGYGGAIDPSNNEVRSLNWTADGWTVATETHMSVPGGAGAMVSTPTELCGFSKALFTEGLVSDASLQMMQTVDDGFGHGLVRFPYGDRWAWGHNGGIDGFSALLGYFPEDDRCLAITTHGSNTDTNDIAILALHTLYGVAWEPPKLTQVTLTVDQLEPLVGTYSSDAVPIDLTITLVGGQLTGQGTGQAAFPLTPIAENEFVFKAAGVRIVFGRPGEMTLYQGGEYAFVRQSP